MDSVPKKRLGVKARAEAAERAETFSIRLMPDMRASLESSAAKAGRSLAAEISWRLERSLDSKLTYQLLDRRFEELEVVVEDLRRLEDRLDSLRRKLEGVRSSGSASDDAAAIAREVQTVAEAMRVTGRQGKRIQEEIDALIADLSDRARIASAPLPS